MRRLLFAALFPALLAAADHWVKFTAGPYEILTDAGTRAGRETLVHFEEFRHALGELVGDPDLKTPEPVRILVFRNAKTWAQTDAIRLGRDRYNIVLEEKEAVAPAVHAELTRLFLASNTTQMPPAFEHGLIEFLSTFELKGIHITVGAPPPQPDLDWARIHMLATDPEYFGRLKVLLFNLRKGIDPDAAYRNAFGKSAAEMEALAVKHLASGNFQTGTISSLPMAEKDFPERDVSDADARLARADLLAGEASVTEYEDLIRDRLKVAEAEEGLGLLALEAHHKDDARHDFDACMQAGSSSARCYIEYAKLEPDAAKATQALLKAAGINPKLDEPFALLAARDTDPRMRLAHWKAAAERNPRNPAYWQALADCYLADHNYGEAAKAWSSAEHAATDPTERARMHQARMAIEEQRLDYEAAEKKREADEDSAEVAKLKQEALAHVHELEAKYSQGSSPTGAPPAEKPVPWAEVTPSSGPSSTLRGHLQQVDCIGRTMRLVVEGDDHKLVRLLVSDPSKLTIQAADAHPLACGKQPGRTVTIEYIPKTNTHLNTVGEAATIEFP